MNSKNLSPINYEALADGEDKLICDCNADTQAQDRLAGIRVLEDHIGYGLRTQHRELLSTQTSCRMKRNGVPKLPLPPR